MHNHIQKEMGLHGYHTLKRCTEQNKQTYEEQKWKHFGKETHELLPKNQFLTIEHMPQINILKDDMFTTVRILIIDLNLRILRLPVF